MPRTYVSGAVGRFTANDPIQTVVWGRLTVDLQARAVLPRPPSSVCAISDTSCWYFSVLPVYRDMKLGTDRMCLLITVDCVCS
jgi:hypothetical protein